MIGMNYKLRALEEKGTPIRTSIVGAGQMGRGLVSQMIGMKGMLPSIVVNRTIGKAIYAYKNAGVPDEMIKIVDTIKEANYYIEKGMFIASSNIDVATKSNFIQAVVDATGSPEAGAKIAVDSINNEKHICMLNVETDICIGHLLYKMATNAGVIYTGSSGDEPGAVMELFDFADAVGFEIKAMGKGKNNSVDKACTPDTVYKEAMDRGINPRMLCSFKDGTKTMVEMTAMANATGFVPDVMGGHGPKSTLDNLTKVLSLKSEGGILNQYGIIDYIDGIAPGVFVIIASDKPDVNHEITYLKLGDGPHFVLYRPFHLCSLETPITIARAVIDKEHTLIPRCGRVAETITVAKRDLKAGEYLDNIGGHTTYGTFAKAEDADRLDAVPMGLINEKTKMIKDVKAGEIISNDCLKLDEDSAVLQIRRIQDSLNL